MSFDGSKDLEKHYGPIEEKVIDALEQVWRFRLPEKYREFLLDYNGGKPIKTFFEFKNKKNDLLLSSFFGVVGEKYYNLLYYYDVIYKYRIPDNTIPIAADQCGNLILLSVKGPDRGKIYFWDHEKEVTDGQVPDYSNLTLIADSFEEFLNSLHTPD